MAPVCRVRPVLQRLYTLLRDACIPSAQDHKVWVQRAFKAHWDSDAQRKLADIQNSIIRDPCLMQFDHNRLLILNTDRSVKGMGYVAAQPGGDEASLAAMCGIPWELKILIFVKESKHMHTPSYSVVGVAGKMRQDCTHIWVKEYLATGLWSTSSTSLLEFHSHGQVNIMSSASSSYHIMGHPAIIRLQIRVLCVSTWTYSTEMENG